MKRDTRALIAKETVAICEAGSYIAPSGARVSIRGELQRAKESTVLYSPENPPIVKAVALPGETQFETKNESTFAALARISEEANSHVACLNFASARNPGGGFLNGALAQEESLACASGLYPCLLTKHQYYEQNRANKSALYLDLAIFSTRWANKGRAVLSLGHGSAMAKIHGRRRGPLVAHRRHGNGHLHLCGFRTDPSAGRSVAKRFARRFERDPDRGYGKMTRIQLRDIMAGAKWRHTAANAFSGQGSMGNGGAMRVAPLGAYFADDLERCVVEASASSLVTHTHPEGVAGTIAVAVAAAMAWQLRQTEPQTRAERFFEAVLQHTPESQVRRGILLASQVPRETSIEDAAKALGNGSLVTAPDTVPFCVWVASHHSTDFVEALAHTIPAGGDCDTNAAIVGGIVALSAGRQSIPTDWLKARERIQI